MKEIKLTQGKVALVDDDDFEFINSFKWCATKIHHIYYAKRGVYVKETQETGIMFMHRLIMGVTDTKIKIDHIDHDGLNNQKYNLRTATHSQNVSHMINRSNGSSKYLGVYFSNTRKRWVAEIMKDYKKKHLGSFLNEQHAAEAYNQAARLIHGEFATLNQI